MKVKNWKGWTEDWVKLAECYSSAPASAGAYIICGDRAINRAVGIDDLGILTIGESSNLRKRLSAFVGCAQNSRGAGHMAGWRFNNSSFQKVFPLKTLLVSWCVLPDKAAAYAKEGEMLALYLAEHYELPPLNYKFNWPKQVKGVLED